MLGDRFFLVESSLSGVETKWSQGHMQQRASSPSTPSPPQARKKPEKVLMGFPSYTLCYLSPPWSHWHCILPVGPPPVPRSPPAYIPEMSLACNTSLVFLKYNWLIFLKCNWLTFLKYVSPIFILFAGYYQNNICFPDFVEFFSWQIIPQLKTTCWVHVPVTIGSSLLMLKFASSSANLKQNSQIIQVVHKMFFLQNKLKKW